MGNRDERGRETLPKDIRENWSRAILSSGSATYIIDPGNIGIRSRMMACHWQLLLHTICTRNMRRARSVPSGKLTRRKLWTFTLSETSCRHNGLKTRQFPDDILVIEPWEFTQSSVWRIARNVFKKKRFVRERRQTGLPLHRLEVWLLLARTALLHWSNFKVPNNIGPRLCGDVGHLSTHFFPTIGASQGKEHFDEKSSHPLQALPPASSMWKLDHSSSRKPSTSYTFFFSQMLEPYILWPSLCCPSGTELFHHCFLVTTGVWNFLTFTRCSRCRICVTWWDRWIIICWVCYRELLSVTIW